MKDGIEKKFVGKKSNTHIENTNAGGTNVTKYENELRRFASMSLSIIVVNPKMITEENAYKNQTSNIIIN
jgi:hypothetical protein